MGEIKSTLDLVMEKTKHLSLSEEEKTVQQKEDARKIANGLIQKYKDRLITEENLKKEWHNLEKDKDISGRQILVEALIDQIDLNMDNSSLIRLLKSISGKDTNPLESILDDYSAKWAEAVQTIQLELKQELGAQFNITGSAVVPNLETDPEWAEALKAFEAKYQDMLETATAAYM